MFCEHLRPTKAKLFEHAFNCRYLLNLFLGGKGEHIFNMTDTFSSHLSLKRPETEPTWGVIQAINGEGPDDSNSRSVHRNQKHGVLLVPRGCRVGLAQEDADLTTGIQGPWGKGGARREEQVWRMHTACHGTANIAWTGCTPLSCLLKGHICLVRERPCSCLVAFEDNAYLDKEEGCTGGQERQQVLKLFPQGWPNQLLPHFRQGQ